MDFEKIVKNLNERGFSACFCESKGEALKKALSLMEENSSVSWGGSMSIIECGLLEKVKEGNFKVIDRETAKSSEERVELMKKALFADYFLCSFNALSEDGIAVNIDGNGNRVAAITFGPKNVIAVVGKNKICKSEEDALKRAKTVAAPKNVVRFGKDESEADSICNIIQILKRGGNGRIKVILCGEELGF